MFYQKASSCSPFLFISFNVRVAAAGIRPASLQYEDRMDVVGTIIEAVSEESLAIYFRDNLLNPWNGQHPGF